jgi:hypothetical protein
MRENNLIKASQIEFERKLEMQKLQQQAVNSSLLDKIDELLQINRKNSSTSSASASSAEERLHGVNKVTIDNSINLLREIPTEDSILNALFNALFFAKPVMMLRKLAKIPDDFLWSDISRSALISTAGVRGEDGKVSYCDILQFFYKL